MILKLNCWRLRYLAERIVKCPLERIRRGCGRGEIEWAHLRCTGVKGLPAWNERTGGLFPHAAVLERRNRPGAHERLPDALADQIVDEALLSKTDFGLRRMHVDVNLVEGELDKKEDDRISRCRHGVEVSLPYGTGHDFVAHHPLIHKEELRVCIGPLLVRLRCKTVNDYIAGASGYLHQVL